MKKNKPRDEVTTLDRANNYEILEPLLKAMYLEFQELSRKKPDGVLNKNKIQVVNRLLKDVLKILDDEPSRAYLDLVNEDEIPQYSDIALLLSQYRAAMGQFHDRYYRFDREARVSRWWI